MSIRHFYLVRPDRFLHFPNFSSAHRVWAKPGEYVEATHPMLNGWIQKQLGKVQAVAVVPRGSVLIDESKLPRGVSQMMSQHDKGQHRGMPVTTEDIYESDEARAAAGEPAPLSDHVGASGAQDLQTGDAPPSSEDSQEPAAEPASAAAGDPGGIPDIEPPK